jgi:hypothetical protein
MEEAIFAKAGGTLPHPLPQGCWHMSAHAGMAARRALAFTMDMTWFNIM